MNSRIRSMRAPLDALEPRVLLASDTALVELAGPGIGQPAALSDEEAPLQQLHEATGVDDAHALGLLGMGQTVVIIDSGIAYDHEALGGGFGEDYRVVGGWDFTEENDADPYDDGPAGFHGTHVAGIVASSDLLHRGVAPDVDLVALRIFNDQGRGKLSWLESSLQWVIDNKDAFEHPITTVNLSLGTLWNSLTLPDYASLEDEFQTLRSEGIFVVAAAGNRFDGANQGLSYPAVSPHVTAASSWNGESGLSSFSQRHTSAFVVPGESITSTVPDFLFDFNGVADDYYAASGTSMAAPYLAGASVLVREAMHRSGVAHVTVSAIENVLSATADTIHDPATNQSYRLINVGAAIRKVLGAQQPALVHVSSRTLHVQGTDGRDVIQLESNRVLINDQAFSVRPTDFDRIVIRGDGRDELQVFLTASNATISMRPGTVEIDSPSSHLLGDDFAEIKVFASGPGTHASFEGGANEEHLTIKPTHSWMQGSDYLNYVRGAARITATTSESQDSVLFYGSSEHDHFSISPGVARVNSSSTSAVAFGFTTVGIRSNQGGQDSATVMGGRIRNQVRSTPDYVSLKSNAFFVYLQGVELVTMHGKGAFDSASVNDTQGDDQLTLGALHHHFQTSTYEHRLVGFESVHAYATHGNDKAVFVGSAAAEQFTAKATHSWMVLGSQLSYARGFDQIEIHGGGGLDLARLYDGAGDETFTLSPNAASVVGDQFRYQVDAVSRIHSISTQGLDSARLHDSELRDQLYATEKGVWMSGKGFVNSLEGFEHIVATSSTSHDRLRLSSALAALIAGDGSLWHLDEQDFEFVVEGFAYYG